ncbi:MAG: DUF1700 domain-containing protein [Hungatella sp.]|nr:DUF1700 domain-containing protein [Hungatella sp.]
MSKEEFMKNLEYLLSDIPEEEKKDALDYYQDYLEEAGDMADKAIEEFGSPERIAAIIRSDIRGDLKDGGAFTEVGYEDERFRDPNYQVAKRYDLPEVNEAADNGKTKQKGYESQKNQSSGENPENGGRNGSAYGQQESRRNTKDACEKAGWEHAGSTGAQDGWHNQRNGADPGSPERKRPLGSGEQGRLLKLILFIVLILAALPALLGIGGGILGVVTGVVCVLLAMIVVLAVLTFALVLAGVALCVAGVIAMFSNLLNGLFCFGAGLMVLSFGFIALVISTWFYGKLIPWLLRLCVNGISMLVHRKERAA